MYYIILYVIILIILFLLLYFTLQKKNYAYETFSSFVYEKYKSLSDYDSHVNIQYIKQFSGKLRSYIQNKYNSNQYDERSKKLFKRLLKRFSENRIFKSSNNHTFSKNKGEIIKFCTNTKSINIAQYVIMHEMAHVMNKSYGHNKSFWCLFRRIIKEAVDAGLYEPRDYNSQPGLYCGKPIRNSIYYSNMDCSKY